MGLVPSLVDHLFIFFLLNITEVNLAKLRLPTFSSQHTSIWFRRADAAFKNASIAPEETRANCVLEIIPETVLETIAPWQSDMQSDVLEYSKLKEQILKVLSLTAQQRVNRLNSLSAHLEQQHDVTPSKLWHEINSLMTLPDGKKSNYAHELWRRCLHPAVRATTSSTMVDHMEDQLDKADQHAAILAAKPATAAFSHSSVHPVHHQQPADNHRKQPSQQTNLKDGVCGYHRKYEDRAVKCAPGCTHQPKN